ncbi:MAG: radical SAM protein, partial [Candidatus Subteraquimicrobiales bacterium]|nr:radical SAM protein [Candidatus Subteraquimicrobiales bacterium]
MVEKILKKVQNPKRISKEEALILFEEGDLIRLGKAASATRQRFHPKNAATFIIDRNINYTNICTSKCKFCAFYREKEDKDAYLLSKEEIFAKIDEAISLEATQIMLQGGLHPDLDINYFTKLLSSIKERYDIHLHSFSPPEIAHIAKNSSLSLRETLIKLKEAGLDSLPGGGAEILVDSIRKKVS